jgi:hypothetical protein
MIEAIATQDIDPTSVAGEIEGLVGAITMDTGVMGQLESIEQQEAELE